LRQKARVLVIEAVGTAHIGDHVAKRAQHGKGVAMLQDAGSRLLINTLLRDAKLRSGFAALASRDRHRCLRSAAPGANRISLATDWARSCSVGEKRRPLLPNR